MAWTMAGGRRSHQGTFWGDLIGPNPTRGKAGTKRTPCGWRGRPLEHCGCGSKRARCQAVGGDPGRQWSNGPPRRNPNTCVWTKGMTILQAVGLPPDTAIGSTSDASGEAGRLWRQAVSGAPVGCGQARAHLIRLPSRTSGLTSCCPHPARRWVVDEIGIPAEAAGELALICRYHEGLGMIGKLLVAGPDDPSPTPTAAVPRPSGAGGY